MNVCLARFNSECGETLILTVSETMRKFAPRQEINLPFVFVVETMELCPEKWRNS